jgi:hypothetical protein
MVRIGKLLAFSCGLVFGLAGCGDGSDHSGPSDAVVTITRTLHPPGTCPGVDQLLVKISPTETQVESRVRDIAVRNQLGRTVYDLTSDIGLWYLYVIPNDRDAGVLARRISSYPGVLVAEPNYCGQAQLGRGSITAPAGGIGSSCSTRPRQTARSRPRWAAS